MKPNNIREAAADFVAFEYALGGKNTKVLAAWEDCGVIKLLWEDPDTGQWGRAEYKQDGTLVIIPVAFVEE